MAKEKKSLIQEFKEFALQGNLFDMAVGVLIGGVFKDLVSAFTDNIIMPIISIFTGSVDFSSWRIALPSLFGDKIDPETGEVVTNYLNFGNFISAIITFLMEPVLTLVLIAVMPFIAVSVYLVTKRGIPLFNDQQVATDGMTRIVRENAQGIRIIKALGKESAERERFDGANRVLNRTEKRAALNMAAQLTK